MNSLEQLLRKTSDLMAEKRLPWALVGGLAVSVRTEPRFTRDLDVAVAVPDDAAAESLIHDLHGEGFMTRAAVEQEQTNRLATARLAPAGTSESGLMLDVLFASSGIEKEICDLAQAIEVFPDVKAPVAQIHHLIALKALARDDASRPQDAADLRHLIAVAAPSDLEAACSAARLIEKRGFNRSRDMLRAVKRAWKEFRKP